MQSSANADKVWKSDANVIKRIKKKIKQKMNTKDKIKQ